MCRPLRALEFLAMLEKWPDHCSRHPHSAIDRSASRTPRIDPAVVFFEALVRTARNWPGPTSFGQPMTGTSRCPRLIIAATQENLFVCQSPVAPKKTRASEVNRS